MELRWKQYVDRYWSYADKHDDQQVWNQYERPPVLQFTDKNGHWHDVPTVKITREHNKATK